MKLLPDTKSWSDHPLPAEKKKAALIAALCLGLAFLPYIAGWFASSPEWQFEGLLGIHIEDSRSYLAAMHQGAAGAWRFHILYTPEEHEGIYLYLFYLLLGKAARLLGIRMIAAYHIARLLAGAALLAALYIFIAHFLRDPTWRLVAYVLASLGSGLGWMLALAGLTAFLGWPPTDFWLTDAYIFFTILLFPHGALAVALLLFALLAVLRYYESGEGRWLLGIALLALSLSFVQPLCAVILDVAAACYTVSLRLSAGKPSTVLRARYGAALLALLAAQAPLFIHYIDALLKDPIMWAWQAQNITSSPSPLHYLLGYGVILALAALGAAETIGAWRGALHLGRGNPEAHRRSLLLMWVAAVAVLLFLPGAQRRYSQGLLVPLAILAAQGLRGWISAKRQRQAALRPFITLAVLSSITLTAAWTFKAAQGDEGLFHSRQELAAVDWLGAHTCREEVVLSSAPVGSLIPARTGHRVFWGHWCETAYVEEKAEEVRRFFSQEADDSWRKHFLARYGVRYVFWGPEERRLGGFLPEEVPYLQERYWRGDYIIFEVAPQLPHYYPDPKSPVAFIRTRALDSKRRFAPLEA